MRDKVKETWIVSAYARDRNYGIQSLELHFRLGARCDAAEDVAEAIRYNAPSSVDYRRQRADSIRKQTGDTCYYGEPRRAELEIHMQANYSGEGERSVTDWYAPRLCGGDINADTARAIATLAKLHNLDDMQPEAIIAALKAKTVSYCSDASVYVDADISDALLSPKAKAAAEAVKIANAA